MAQALLSLESRQIPARPLLGALPLARVIPQDVHSVMDYAGGITCATAGFLADSPSARIAGAVLGGSVIGLSALTDYRLSVAKLVPIEVHEVTDYIWGAMCILAPFVLGYARRDPLAATVHVITGASTILASLVTDYRAAEGAGRATLPGDLREMPGDDPLVEIGSAAMISV